MVGRAEANCPLQRGSASSQAQLYPHCSFSGLHPQQGGRWPSQALCIPLHARHVLPDLGHGLSCHFASREGTVGTGKVTE